jgi:glycerol uptake facilitator-like aquaporin
MEYSGERPEIGQRLIAEFLGTAVLMAAVVASSLWADYLPPGLEQFKLMVQCAVIGLAAAILMAMTRPISGGHLNPVLTLTSALDRKQPWANTVFYPWAQVAGALAGVAAAHWMFGLEFWQEGTQPRAEELSIVAEFLSAMGFLVLLTALAQARVGQAAFIAGIYIALIYGMTDTTSLANPAVTVARGFTEAASGFRLWDVGPFVLTQFSGALAGLAIGRWFWPPEE